MTTAAYTATGRPSSLVQPNGVGVTYSYDSLDRVLSLAWRKGTAPALASWSYSYSPRGQRLSSTDLTSGEAAYAYAAASRLTSETISGDPSGNGALTYTLDPTGNRLSRSSTLAALAAQSFSYDANDELTTDSYDLNGNSFGGYLQADASNVYDVLERGRPKDTDEGVTLVGCFAHLRRYFFEAAICRYPAGLQGLMRIRAIYAADQAVSRALEAERKALREQHVRPLATSFFDWARGARASVQGRNLATKALGYAVNQEAELMRVLDDVKLPLDNTRSERALRKIVVGRKAWMFYGSDTHAEVATAIFSVIASCRLHLLDPFTYLDEILRVLPFWPRDRYLELAPKNWRATRGRLRPEELAAPLSAFEIPPPLPAPAPPTALTPSAP